MKTILECIEVIRKNSQSADDALVDRIFNELRQVLLTNQAKEDIKFTVSSVAVEAVEGLEEIGVGEAKPLVETIDSLLTRAADAIKKARAASAQDVGEQRAVVSLQRLLAAE